jgi:hypothetical protein
VALVPVEVIRAGEAVALAVGEGRRTDESADGRAGAEQTRAPKERTPAGVRWRQFAVGYAQVQSRRKVAAREKVVVVVMMRVSMSHGFAILSPPANVGLPLRKVAANRKDLGGIFVEAERFLAVFPSVANAKNWTSYPE